MATKSIRLAIPAQCPSCHMDFLAEFQPVFHVADFLARLPDPQRQAVQALEQQTRAKLQAATE